MIKQIKKELDRSRLIWAKTFELGSAKEMAYQLSRLGKPQKEKNLRKQAVEFSYPNLNRIGQYLRDWTALLLTGQAEALNVWEVEIPIIKRNIRRITGTVYPSKLDERTQRDLWLIRSKANQLLGVT